MKHDPSARWEAIASHTIHETPPIENAVPFGFSTRVVSLWRAAQRDEALRRWSLWSLRAAVCSVAVCGLVVGYGAVRNDSAILLSPPAAEFVVPPLSTP